MKKRCENPNCGVEYDVADESNDSGTCSFECWEKLNCHEPEKIWFELLEVQ